MLPLQSTEFIVHKTFDLCEFRRIHSKRKCTCMKTKKCSKIVSQSGTKPAPKLATKKAYLEAFEKFAPAFSFQTTCHRDKLYYLMLHVGLPTTYDTLLSIRKLLGISLLELQKILSDYPNLFFLKDKAHNIWMTVTDAEAMGFFDHYPMPEQCPAPPHPDSTSDRSKHPIKSGITCASEEEIESAAIATVAEYNRHGETHMSDDELLYRFMCKLPYPARERDLKPAVYNILGYSKAESSFRKALNSDRYRTLVHGVKAVHPNISTSH